MPHRPSHPPRRRQSAMLRDCLLRRLHSDPSSRKGLHLSTLWVEGGLVGQAGHRLADAAESGGLHHKGDRSEPEGRRRTNHDRIHSSRRAHLSGNHNFTLKKCPDHRTDLTRARHCTHRLPRPTTPSPVCTRRKRSQRTWRCPK